MSVILRGIRSNLPGDDRALAVVEVHYNGNEYEWQVYIPPHVENAHEYLEQAQNSVYQEIQAKEDMWASMSDEEKFSTTVGENGEEIRTPLMSKEEIVAPTIPDNYARRKNSYPPIGDQLDAYWAGPGTSKYKNMMDRIKAVKDAFPVNSMSSPPEYITATQVRLWLVENDVSLANVEAAISSIEDPKVREKTRVQWEYAPYIERNHPLMNAIGAMLGMTGEQIDAAFLQASQIS